MLRKATQSEYGPLKDINKGPERSGRRTSIREVVDNPSAFLLGVRVFFYLEDRERTIDSPTNKIMLSLTSFADELDAR